MYKKILVPLDGSKRAEAILPHVEELAHRYDAHVIFLKVIEPIKVFAAIDSFVPNPDTLQHEHKNSRKRAKTYLMGLVMDFQKKKISAKTNIKTGPIVSTIIDVAEQEGVDLIAMASHGRTGLAHVFYGSVAAGVLHRIDRPLLLIRANAQ